MRDDPLSSSIAFYRKSYILFQKDLLDEVLLDLTFGKDENKRGLSCAKLRSQSTNILGLIRLYLVGVSSKNAFGVYK